MFGHLAKSSVSALLKEVGDECDSTFCKSCFYYKFS